MKPHEIQQLVAMKASGTPQTEIAKTLGYSNATISNVCNRPDVKPIIEGAAQVLAEIVLPQAVANQAAVISHANAELTLADNARSDGTSTGHAKARAILNDSIDILKLSDKKERHLLQSVGVLTSQTPSFVFNNLTVDARHQTVIDGDIVALLGGAGNVRELLGSSVDGDTAIDVDATPCDSQPLIDNDNVEVP